MGFFEAGNFYPDYILWIDTEDKQYISFIDPKGLMHIRPDDPKVEFIKPSRSWRNDLAPTADGKTVILNSFIMSGTKINGIENVVEYTRGGRRSRISRSTTMYTLLDNTECVELMINKTY